MALLALEEAFTIGSKFVAPLLFDSIFTSATAGSLLSNGRGSVPVQSNPSATPTSASDPNLLANRLRTSGLDPTVVSSIATSPLQPPQPEYPTGRTPARPTRADIEAKYGTFTDSNADYVLQNEVSAIAAFFQTTPDAIAAIPELSAIATNAITGEGPVFTRWMGQRLARDMNFIMNAEESLVRMSSQAPVLARALAESKSDYELKLGGPISSINFFRSIAANGVSRSRIESAWNRIVGPIGDNPSTRAVFRRWLTNRLLPGAAGSAVTYLLDQILSRTGQPTPGVSVPQETSNREFRPTDYSVEQAREDLLSKELQDAFRQIQIGDEAQNIIGSQTWNSKLSPPVGSVQWTPNTFNDSGLNDERPLPLRFASTAPDVPSYPGDSIYSAGLTGDTLSERLYDPRANTKNVSMRLPDIPPPARTSMAPYLVVPNDAPPPGSMGIHHMHNTKPYFMFPAIHESARETDHMVSQTYDPSMVATLPSFVTPVTSSAGNLYGRADRAYRNTLESAPNVTGLGFDTQETERRMVESVAMEDEGRPAPYPQAYFKNDQQTTYTHDTATPYVPISNASNPVFANVGARVPVAPLGAPSPPLM